MLKLTSLSESFIVDFTPAADLDIAGYKTHVVKAEDLIEGDFVPTESNLVNQGPDTNFTIAADGGGMRYVKIAAYDSFGEDTLNYSAVYSVNVASGNALDTVAPDAPHTLTYAVTTVGTGAAVYSEVKVLWVQDSIPDDFANFTIRHRRTTGTNDAPWIENSISDSAIRAYLITPLDINQQYDIQVAAVDRWSNQSAWSTLLVASTSDQSIVAPVSGLSFTSGVSSVTAVWNPSLHSAFLNYVVERATSADFTVNKVTSSPVEAKYTYTAVAGTTYYIRVKVVTSLGTESAWSAASNNTSFDNISANRITTGTLAATETIAVGENKILLDGENSRINVKNNAGDADVVKIGKLATGKYGLSVYKSDGTTQVLRVDEDGAVIQNATVGNLTVSGTGGILCGSGTSSFKVWESAVGTMSMYLGNTGGQSIQWDGTSLNINANITMSSTSKISWANNVPADLSGAPSGILNSSVTADTLNVVKTDASNAPASILNSSLSTDISNAAQTALWTSVTSRPTTLSALDSMAGTKLSGIAEGATKAGSICPDFYQWNCSVPCSIETVTYGITGTTVLRMPVGSGYATAPNYYPIDRTKTTFKVSFWVRADGFTDNNGLFYFALRQFTDFAGTVGPVNSGLSPYKPGGETKDTNGGNGVWRFYEYEWGPADWQAGVVCVEPITLGNYAGTSGYWEVQGIEVLDTTGILNSVLTPAIESAATTANWTTVVGHPTSLATLNTTDGTKLSGIAEGATSNITLIVNGSATLTGNSVAGGDGATWASATCYSKDGYTDGAYCSFTATGYSYFMAGLNTDPTLNANYDTLDFAFFLNGTGVLMAYESNVSIGQLGSYTDGDILSIIYDGMYVRYFQNGTLVRGPVTIGSGKKFFFDSSIVTATIKNIQFGPLTTTRSDIDGIVRNPVGGYYSTTTPTITGTLKITLPNPYATTYPMLKFTVDIYEYAAGISCTLSLGGHISEGNWYQVSALVVGGNVEYPVWFGHDGVNSCVYIGAVGETWSYPQVVVRDVMVGYINTDKTIWEKGWNIDFVGSMYSYSQVVSDTYPPANWAKIAGTGKPADNADVTNYDDTRISNSALPTIYTQAQIEAYATTITEDTVTTAFVNALEVTAHSIKAENIDTSTAKIISAQIGDAAVTTLQVQDGAIFAPWVGGSTLNTSIALANNLEYTCINSMTIDSYLTGRPMVMNGRIYVKLPSLTTAYYIVGILYIRRSSDNALIGGGGRATGILVTQMSGEYSEIAVFGSDSTFGFPAAGTYYVTYDVYVYDSSGTQMQIPIGTNTRGWAQVSGGKR